MKISRKLFATALSLLCVLAAAPVAAQSAAQYPDKPIKIVNGFAAGGSLDTLARLVADKLNKAWGQPVVVDNRTGGGGMTSAQLVARANPDGYTLLMTAPGFMAASPHLHSNLQYDPVTSFAPLTRLVVGPYLLAVKASLPVNDLKGFIELAKAKPGTLSMANAGTGSATHLDSEHFALQAGIKVIHVPYKGSAPATTDLLGGQVDAQMTDMTTLAPHIRSGKLKGLAVMSAQRSSLVPDVPTAMESAMPGFQSHTWFGIVAPAGTPRDIVDKLNRELVRAMAMPDVKEKLAQGGFLVATTTPQEMSSLIRSDIDRMGDVVKRAGVKAE